MFTVSVSRGFDAAHSLPGMDGRCAGLHGHHWYVEVSMAAEETGPEGVVMDFDSIGRALEEVLEDYDHRYLNEVAPFNEIPPTAENIAREIFERLAARADADGWEGEVRSVTVKESEDTGATYSR